MHCSWLPDSLAGVGPLKPAHENNNITENLKVALIALSTESVLVCALGQICVHNIVKL